MRLGGEVDDRVAPRGRSRDGLGVGDVADDELDARPREVRGVARVRQLVEHHHVVAARDEPLHEMRSDEAGSAGHEHAHPRKGTGRPNRQRRCCGTSRSRRCRHARSPSRQCGSVGAPFSLRRIEWAGRGRRAPNSAEVIRRTRQSRPASSKTPRRGPPTCSPRRPRDATPRTAPRPRRASASLPRDAPRTSGSRAGRRRPPPRPARPPRRSIVRTKLCPVSPNSHDVRTIHARSPAAPSPWSFVRP